MQRVFGRAVGLQSGALPAHALANNKQATLSERRWKKSSDRFGNICRDDDSYAKPSSSTPNQSSYMRTPMLVGFVVAVSAALSAQTKSTKYPDPHVAGPDIYRMVLENESIRMYEVTFKPGARITPHDVARQGITEQTGERIARRTFANARIVTGDRYFDRILFES